MKNQHDVLGLKFTNSTEKKQYASLFQVFSDNSGLVVQSTHCNHFDFNNLKNWLMNHKMDIELVRFQFGDCKENKKLYFRKFIFQSGNPFGSMMQIPMFVIGENFSPNQFQSGIVDIPVDAEFDGYSTDIIFEIEPNESFTVTMFSKVEKKKLKDDESGFDILDNVLNIDKGLTPFKGFPIVVENDSDEPMTIDLFSEDHYRKLVEYDKNGKVYNLYEGEDSFGSKHTIYGEDKKEYGYIFNLQRIKNKGLYIYKDKSYKGYDVVRLVNPNQDEFTDLVVNGRIIKTNGYKSEHQFLNIALDMRLDSEEKFDSFIVTVAPKSMMMYSFGNYDEIKNYKPND